MSAFRMKIWTILGSVAGLSGCSGDAAEADLREGLEGSGADLCRTGEHGSVFSHVANLNPQGSYDYFEFREAYDLLDAETAEAFLQEKATIVDETSLSLAEKEAALEDLLQGYAVHSIETSGECDYSVGCDKFFVPESSGDLLDAEGSRRHLFATGASGPAFVTTADEAREFLGTIDTPEEAAWIAYAERYRPVCDGVVFLEKEDGYELYVEQGSTCGGDVSGFRVSVSSDGVLEVLDSAVVVEGNDNCVIGRLPSGRVSGLCERGDEHPAGRYFAENARLEAASVVAFRELAMDLEGHKAPEWLVQWARRAADEEMRHAKLCTYLARRYGSAGGPVLVRRAERRSLLEIARDNAVEGLTREAFGALLAHHQMLAAKDPEVHRVMKTIARDEASHAEFSIALHEWLTNRLTAEEREVVENERSRARVEFRAAAQTVQHDDIIRLAGMPSANVARAMFDALFVDSAAA